jgi:biopolymer transport protein ExbD
MATINEKPTSGSRPQRTSAKVDFTAMVDLAFLLITFFMLTTSLAKLNVMPLIMPEDQGVTDPPKTADSKVLTLLLAGNDKIYYYEGINNARLDSTDYSSGGIRKVILDKKHKVDALFGVKMKADTKKPDVQKTVSELTILIKPMTQSRYKNMVDVFDEMKICSIAYYMMLDPSDAETSFINNPAAGLHFDENAQLRSFTKG